MDDLLEDLFEGSVPGAKTVHLLRIDLLLDVHTRRFHGGKHNLAGHHFQRMDVAVQDEDVIIGGDFNPTVGEPLDGDDTRKNGAGESYRRKRPIPSPLDSGSQSSRGGKIAAQSSLPSQHELRLTALEPGVSCARDKGLAADFVFAADHEFSD